MEESKKEKLYYQMDTFIDKVLRTADREGKLDHFVIEISNCEGKLQMDYKLRDRRKVY